MKYIAIIGTRDYPTTAILAYLLTMEHEGEICLLTGGHTASEAAKKMAKVRGWQMREYLPDYKTNGQGATHMRSKAMMQDAHEVLTFWNGVSKGTENEIKIALKMGKKITHCGERERKQVGGLF